MEDLPNRVQLRHPVDPVLQHSGFTNLARPPIDLNGEIGREFGEDLVMTRRAHVGIWMRIGPLQGARDAGSIQMASQARARLRAAEIFGERGRQQSRVGRAAGALGDVSRDQVGVDQGAAEGLSQRALRNPLGPPDGVRVQRDQFNFRPAHRLQRHRRAEA